MNKNTGGAAFPSTQDQWERGMEGMTLRDWFAGQALSVYRDETIYVKEHETNMQARARLAYAIADAMLAERSKE